MEGEWCSVDATCGAGAVRYPGRGRGICSITWRALYICHRCMQESRLGSRAVKSRKYTFYYPSLSSQRLSTERRKDVVRRGVDGASTVHHGTASGGERFRTAVSAGSHYEEEHRQVNYRAAGEQQGGRAGPLGEQTHKDRGSKFDQRYGGYGFGEGQNASAAQGRSRAGQSRPACAAEGAQASSVVDPAPAAGVRRPPQERDLRRQQQALEDVR